MRFVSDWGTFCVGKMLTIFSTFQQALMPDILHWLGITKIDRMYVSIPFLPNPEQVANDGLLQVEHVKVSP